MQQYVSCYNAILRPTIWQSMWLEWLHGRLAGQTSSFVKNSKHFVEQINDEVIREDEVISAYSTSMSSMSKYNVSSEYYSNLLIYVYSNTTSSKSMAILKIITIIYSAINLHLITGACTCNSLIFV